MLALRMEITELFVVGSQQARPQSRHMGLMSHWLSTNLYAQYCHPHSTKRTLGPVFLFKAPPEQPQVVCVLSTTAVGPKDLGAQTHAPASLAGEASIGL